MRSQFGRTGYTASNSDSVDISTLFLAKVFNWMAIGLALTAIIAFMVVSNETFVNYLYSNRFLIFGAIIIEIGLVVYLSARIQKISAGTAKGLFFLYSALNGLTLSSILLVYTATSVFATFVVTAGMFGAMAVYGLVTKKDLSGLGSFLMMGLFGMVIAIVVNIFLQSSMMSFIISGIGVLVFTGLTAYDVQNIKQMGSTAMGQEETKKLAILGALTLYLDFINLFISLLRFMGDRD